MSEEKQIEVVTLDNITVSKEMYELMKAPSNITVAILEKAADGLSVDEIVSALASNVSAILAAADGAKGIVEEVKQDPGAFMRAISIPTSGVLSAAVQYSRAKDALEASAAEAKAAEEAPPPAEAAPAPEAPAAPAPEPTPAT